MSRDSVREPLDNRIHVPLIGVDPADRAEMALSVQQALELASLLTSTVGDFCRRRDVADALNRTEPLYS